MPKTIWRQKRFREFDFFLGHPLTLKKPELKIFLQVGLNNNQQTNDNTFLVNSRS